MCHMDNIFITEKDYNGYNETLHDFKIADYLQTKTSTYSFLQNCIIYLGHSAQKLREDYKRSANNHKMSVN